MRKLKPREAQGHTIYKWPDFNPRAVSCSATRSTTESQVTVHEEAWPEASMTALHSGKQGGPLQRLICHQSPVETHQECGCLCPSSTDKCQLGFGFQCQNEFQTFNTLLDPWNGPPGSEHSHPSVWEVSRHYGMTACFTQTLSHKERAYAWSWPIIVCN